MSTKPTIAFFGLGTMGGGMARRLLGAGYTVSVWNRDPAKTAPFANEGAKVAPTPRDAAANADILHLGPNGAGATLKLINNFVCGVQAATLGEAFAMVERTGLNPEKALPLILNGNAGSPLVKAFGGRITTNDPGVYFHLELMAK